MRETARELGIDLATGERYFTKWQYAPLLAGQFVDVIQPDLCHAGGITEVKKIAALAEVHHVLVAPHNPQGPLSTAAAAHIGMSIPNYLMLEYVPSQPYRDKVVKEPWHYKRRLSARAGHAGFGRRPRRGRHRRQPTRAAFNISRTSATTPARWWTFRGSDRLPTPSWLSERLNSRLSLW